MSQDYFWRGLGACASVIHKAGLVRRSPAPSTTTIAQPKQETSKREYALKMVMLKDLFSKKVGAHTLIATAPIAVLSTPLSDWVGDSLSLYQNAQLSSTIGLFSR